MYAGTTLLFRHHSKKLGKIKYWIVICLPLIPVLAGLLPTLQGGKEQQETLAEQTGVEPSITEEDMNDNLADVLEEVKKLHNKP
jgi:hypothetical protein